MLLLEWAGEELELMADRAVHWRSTRSVILADAHFGKAAAYRNLGVPVPNGTTQHDVERLARLVTNTKAARLIIVGDFLHARGGRSDETMAAIEAWRRHHMTLEIVLVRGNHDHHAGDPPSNWNINCVDGPFIERSLAFCHEPGAEDGRHVICGHVHPCATLHDVDGSSLRAPCFLFSKRCAILPAFGSFTGAHRVRPKRGDRIFAIGNDAVVEVPAVRPVRSR